MKRKEFIFIEIIITLTLVSILILPLITLMGKNARKVNFLKNEYELKKLMNNLEIVFLHILKEKNNRDKNYSLIRKDNKFLLLQDNKELIALNNIEVSDDLEFLLEKNIIFFDSSKLEQKFHDIFIINLKTKDKTIKRVLSL